MIRTLQTTHPMSYPLQLLNCDRPDCIAFAASWARTFLSSDHQHRRIPGPWVFT